MTSKIERLGKDRDVVARVGLRNRTANSSEGVLGNGYVSTSRQGFCSMIVMFSTTNEFRRKYI